MDFGFTHACSSLVFGKIHLDPAIRVEYRRPERQNQQCDFTPRGSKTNCGAELMAASLDYRGSDERAITEVPRGLHQLLDEGASRGPTPRVPCWRAMGPAAWIRHRGISYRERSGGAAIIGGIDGSKIVVLIFSGRSATSTTQVRREVKHDQQGAPKPSCRSGWKMCVPVGAMEYALSNTHWLDAFTPPVERQMEILAESVRVLLGDERGMSKESASGSSPALQVRIQMCSWLISRGSTESMGIPPRSRTRPRRT